MANDYKRIIIEFKDTGIFLDEVPSPNQPPLDKQAWRAAVLSAVNLSPPPPSVPGGHLQDLPLSSIGFDPSRREHRFDISQDRVTQIAFELKKPANAPNFISPGWLFVEDSTVAFRIKDNTPGAANFSNTTVWPGRRIVTVTHTPPPSSAPPLYIYELRVEAPVWKANSTPPASQGHMIIIIDPIIGNVEV
jgi:hypothetical protein